MNERRSTSALAVLRLSIALVASLTSLAGARAQCNNNNSLLGSAITVSCPGTYSPAPCVKGGQYVLVNVTAGTTYTFSTCGNNVFNTTMTLYNNAGGAAIAASYDACGNQSSITWTATYTGQLRVLLDRGASCNSSGSCTSLSISCSAPPANDNPCGAFTLPVGANCTNYTPTPTVTAATATAGVPAPSCGGYAGGDVWFKLTVPAGGSLTVTTSTVTNSPFTDGGMAIYSSSNNTCSGTFSQLACNDDIDFPYNNMSSITLTGQTAGNTLFVRIWGRDLTESGLFNICARIPPINPDEPCQAIPLPVGTGCSWTDASNTAASNTTTPAGTGLCGMFTSTGSAGNRSKDIWFSFVAPLSGNVVVQTQAGTLDDGAMALYSTLPNTCTGTFTLIQCDDDSGPGYMPYIYRTGLTSGQTYWIRFWGYGNGTGTFRICLFSPAPNSEADCIGSVAVCDATTITNNSLFTGSTADLNNGNHGCLLDNELQGSWYAYAAATSGTLGFTLTPLANDDYDFAVWGPYPAGSTTSSICTPSSPPIRCSYASAAATYAATNSHSTGMANPSLAFSNPRYAPPTPAFSDPAGGDGWVPGINVVAGQVFLLYISNWSQTGSAFNLVWDLSAGASLDCSVVLPVELLDLSAEVSGPAIEVAWSTASEAHSDHFEVQRSADNADFMPIGSVPAAGTSQQRIDYLFVDKAPLNSANYYRLKQVDIDGASELTHTVVAVFGRKGLTPLLFPNPAREVLHVAFDTPVDGYTLIYVRDALGRVVGGPEALLERGQRTVDLSTDRLAPGFYTVRVALASGEILNGGGFMKQ